MNNFKSLPLVSIIIPTYNYAQYISVAIDSAMKQTYPNIEVVVIDDGSTDNTQSKLSTYGNGIRYIAQSNQGASAARNHGLREAKGEYITFLDADDWYHPQNIEKKVQFLQDNQDFSWCYSNWAWVDEQGVNTRYGHEPEISLAHIKGSGDVLSLALQGYRLGTNVFMFKRELVEKLHGFDPQLHVLEDFDYFLRAAALSPLGFVDEVLCYVFEHEGSLGTGCNAKVAYLSRLRLHQKIKRLFPQQVLLEAVLPAWQKQQADLYRNLADLMLLQGHPNRASVLLRASLGFQCWQLGAALLGLRILLKKVIG